MTRSAPPPTAPCPMRPRSTRRMRPSSSSSGARKGPQAHRAPGAGPRPTAAKPKEILERLRRRVPPLNLPRFGPAGPLVTTPRKDLWRPGRPTAGRRLGRGLRRYIRRRTRQRLAPARLHTAGVADTFPTAARRLPGGRRLGRRLGRHARRRPWQHLVLANSQTTGTADVSFVYGNVGDLPLSWHH